MIYAIGAFTIIVQSFIIDEAMIIMAIIPTGYCPLEIGDDIFGKLAAPTAIDIFSGESSFAIYLDHFENGITKLVSGTHGLSLTLCVRSLQQFSQSYSFVPTSIFWACQKVQPSGVN